MRAKLVLPVCVNNSPVVSLHKQTKSLKWKEKDDFGFSLPQMFHHIGRRSLSTVHPRLAGQANADISNLFVTESNHDSNSLLSSCSFMDSDPNIQ